MVWLRTEEGGGGLIHSVEGNSVHMQIRMARNGSIRLHVGPKRRQVYIMARFKLCEIVMAPTM